MDIPLEQDIPKTSATMSATSRHIQNSPSTKRPTVNSLPNELLSNIFGFINVPRLIEEALYHEPNFDITTADQTDLKNISCVTKSWRAVVFPLLFKHARFILAEPMIQRPVLGRLMRPFFEFVTRRQLRNKIVTFTLIIHDKKVASSYEEERGLTRFASFWKQLFSIIDPIELIIVAHAEALASLAACHTFLEDVWCFDCPCHYLRLQRPPSQATQMPPSNQAVPAKEYAIAEHAYQVIEPVTSNFSTTNLPEDLLKRGSLDATEVTLAESTEETNDTQYTADSLPESSSSFATSSQVQDYSVNPHAGSSLLFEIRPWTKLLLNEGSFVKAYSTYEFWLRQPPSILADLVGCEVPRRKGYITSTIRDMEYIAIFPMTPHFSNLTSNFPRLDRLYVQLVPRNDIMENKSKMSQVESADLWMERNSCYALLMRELFNAPPQGNYKDLEIFESGDAADVDAWRMAVEYVKRANNGWKVAGDGVFVRDPKDLVPEPEGDVQDGEASTFEGSLIRWAWNGTTRLPVSAYPLYDRPMGPLN